ncbi:MAG TPA: hypothetical protein VEY71_06880 [Chitinophagales bacterium]|nr:hypothetical protein [Chitinophagales bacterium]
MKTWKLVLVLFFLAVVGIALFVMYGNYSTGFRAGTVIKLSHKGFAMKTYEGQLNLGMVLSDEPGGTAVSNIWFFSVPEKEKEVVRKLEEAMLTGKRVKLHYKEKFVTLPWRGDTKYMVYNVDEQLPQ